jgi:hypothetical protein
METTCSTFPRWPLRSANNEDLEPCDFLPCQRAFVGAISLQLKEILPNQGLAGASVNLTVFGGGFVPAFVGSAAVLPGSTII